MNKICTLIITLFIYISATCQDTIITTDGDIRIAKSIQIDKEYSEVRYVNLKSKEKIMDMEDVFYFVDSTREKTFIYSQNPALGNELSIPEMSRYITGIQDAKRDYNTRGALITGVCIGFVSHFALIRNVEQKSDGSYTASVANFYAPLVPLAYCTFMTIAIPDKRINKFAKSTDEPYLMGYRSGVRSKRMKSSLLGSGIGLLVGYIVVNAVFAK